MLNQNNQSTKQPLYPYSFNGAKLVNMIEMTFETTPEEWPDLWYIDLTDPTETQVWSQEAFMAHLTRARN